MRRVETQLTPSESLAEDSDDSKKCYDAFVNNGVSSLRVPLTGDSEGENTFYEKHPPTMPAADSHF